MDRHFIQVLEDNPIVAAIKDEAGLEAALRTEVGIIFILHGNICSLPKLVERIKLSGRMAIVHVDLIVGLSNDDSVLDYIKNVAHADGIITTKLNLIQYGKKIGLYTIHRYFRCILLYLILNCLSFNNSPCIALFHLLLSILLANHKTLFHSFSAL